MVLKAMNSTTHSDKIFRNVLNKHFHSFIYLILYSKFNKKKCHHYSKLTALLLF